VLKRPILNDIASTDDLYQSIDCVDKSDENEASKRKKVVFIVPTNNLVDQQSSVIERYTEKVRVGNGGGSENET
jgi:replicative superfamily II helicase